MGLLRDITTLVSQEKVNIASVLTTEHADSSTTTYLTVFTTGVGQLSLLFSRLEGVEGVYSVARSSPEEEANASSNPRTSEKWEEILCLARIRPRVVAKKTLRNRPIRTSARTYVKRAQDSIAGGGAEAALADTREAIRVLDKAAQKGVHSQEQRRPAQVQAHGQAQPAAERLTLPNPVKRGTGQEEQCGVPLLPKWYER